jgi:hypothetical protein
MSDQIENRIIEQKRGICKRPTWRFTVHRLSAWSPVSTAETQAVPLTTAASLGRLLYQGRFDPQAITCCAKPTLGVRITGSPRWVARQ